MHSKEPVMYTENTIRNVYGVKDLMYYIRYKSIDKFCL